MDQIIKPTLKHFSYGDHTVTMSTGMVARQATGAVMVDMDGTTVLVTVVAEKKAKPGQSFFPLTIDFQERAYAYGKIPGGFFRREGRPTERETLTARLIDRPCRPLFPKGFSNEVQLIVTVMSINPEINPDIPALIGASTALTLSGLPFEGPLGAARVGYYNDTYLLNPTHTQLATSQLDLVVAGTEKAVLMVESEAEELSEEIMLGAVMYGHEQSQTLIQEIKTFVQEAGKRDFVWSPEEKQETLVADIKQFITSDLDAAYKIQDKMLRQDALNSAKEKVLEKFTDENSDADTILNINEITNAIEKNMVRAQIIETKKRIDGRDTTTVRPIAVNVGVLPRAHGSALFTRGETQAFVITTLGTAKDAQMIEHPVADYRDTFMLHYNFPPYSVGETGRVGSPKRREIGHGNLARRGVKAVLPKETDFPYVTRVVSEITESNGSSSMATVCGTSLALMDAGVPLKTPVAGIAMGLIKEEQDVVVLTDILGDEDHLGDMDFKVAGTHEGVTALQMDIKINGITEEIMSQALTQAKSGRLHILDIMATAISNSRQEVSPFAPRLLSFKIDQEKIRDVIGKGGATIRSLCESTGAVIEIDDVGMVTVSAPDDTSAQEAKRQVEMLTFDVEIDSIYEGEVTRIEPFGAFVSIAPNKTGLVHISQITDGHVERVEDYINFGAKVRVKVIDIDRQGRIKLSMKGME